MTDPLAWGRRVSPAFRDRVRAIAANLLCVANHLMAGMAFETGYTFSPSKKNAAGSSAIGLIQFMDKTAKALGTTTTALASMTAEQQLDFVEAYFRPYRGRLKNLGDVYMAIFWPAAIGKPDSYVLIDRAKHPTAYAQNKGLDSTGDGKITRGEAYARVAAALAEGLLPGNAA